MITRVKHVDHVLFTCSEQDVTCEVNISVLLSPVLTSDASISISIRIQIAYALVRTAMT